MSADSNSIFDEPGIHYFLSSRLLVGIRGLISENRSQAERIAKLEEQVIDVVTHERNRLLQAADAVGGLPVGVYNRLVAAIRATGPSMVPTRDRWLGPEEDRILESEKIQKLQDIANRRLALRPVTSADANVAFFQQLQALFAEEVELDKRYPSHP